MTGPSAPEIGISGLRFTAREPKTVLVWSGLGFLIALAGLVAKAMLAGGDFQILTDTTRTAPFGDLAAAFARWQGPSLIFTFVSLAVVAGAVYRAVLRPEERGLAYLRLGRDELRMVAVFALLLLIVLGALILTGVVASLLGVVLISAGGGIEAWSTMLSISPAVGLLVVAAWLGPRLSLVAPMAFAEGRIRLAAAWRLTRGHYWPLLGALILTLLLMAAITGVAWGLRGLAAAAAGGLSLAEGYGILLQPQGEGLAAVFAPARLAALAAGALLTGVYYVVMLAPGVVAYRAWRPREDVSETFA